MRIVWIYCRRSYKKWEWTSNKRSYKKLELSESTVGVLIKNENEPVISVLIKKWELSESTVGVLIKNENEPVKTVVEWGTHIVWIKLLWLSAGVYIARTHIVWIILSEERKKKERRMNNYYSSNCPKMAIFKTPYFSHFSADFQKSTLYRVLRVLLCRMKP